MTRTASASRHSQSVESSPSSPEKTARPSRPRPLSGAGHARSRRLTTARAASPSSRSKVAGGYTNFSFRAVVDWVELTLTTARPTNFMTMKGILGVEYVKPKDEGPGRAATVFQVRFHEPKSWHDVEAALKRLEAHADLASDPQVTEIELSFDAYNLTGPHTELVDLAAHFYRGCTLLVSSNRRLYRRTHETQEVVSHQLLKARLTDGFNLNVGSPSGGDAVIQHVYVKQKDAGKSLPKDQWRARYEVRLSGAALPFTALSDWARVDFTRFAKYFKYRKVIAPSNRFVAAALEVLPQIGEKRPRRKAPFGTRNYSRNTVADRALNAAAFDALRELNRRMRGYR